MEAYLIDLDGTLADNTHRQHYLDREPKDWNGFFDAMSEDKPISHMVTLVQDLWGYTQHEIIIVTVRPETHRAQTERWLANQFVLYDKLRMRKEKDHRPDPIVKKEILWQLIKEGVKPILAIDDRPEVIKMWRANGVPVLEVFNPLWVK